MFYFSVPSLDSLTQCQVSEWMNEWMNHHKIVFGVAKELLQEVLQLWLLLFLWQDFLGLGQPSPGKENGVVENGPESGSLVSSLESTTRYLCGLEELNARFFTHL